MKAAIILMRDFLRDEEGAELVEWIVFVALLVLGIGVAVVALRSAINTGYDGIKSCIANAKTGNATGC